MDRIIDVNLSDDIEYFENEDIIPEGYYKDVIGVTVVNLQPIPIKIFINKSHAPYVT